MFTYNLLHSFFLANIAFAKQSNVHLLRIFMRNQAEDVKKIETKIHKTQAFINCKGVFQGGGCKAFGYIGAYDMAIRCGASFSEFAGTSAGSIIAAFAAAGATPEQMKEIVENTDFSVLNQGEKNLWSKFYKSCGSYFFKKRGKGLLKHLINYFSNEKFGFYDSSIIYDIVDENLSKLLELDSGVRFEDLKFPLTIVACDLKDHKIMKWSREVTPKVIVAKAVQCSCCVPIVFKPVDNKYVDGGLLCNLPTAVFSKSSFDFDRILAFSTSPTINQEDHKVNIMDIFYTIINGSVDLQQRIMGQSSSAIVIPTEAGLLDFEKYEGKGLIPELREAYEAGENATLDFFKKESEEPLNASYHSEIFTNKEQLRSQVVFYSSFYEHSDIYISSPRLEWAQSLFLLIYKWREDCANVHVYTEDENVNEFVRQTLLDMGVKIYLSKSKLPVYGYFFRKEEEDKWLGIVANEHVEIAMTPWREDTVQSDYEKVYTDWARCLNDKEEKFVIESLVQSLQKGSYTCLNPECETLPVIQKCEEQEIIDILTAQPLFQDCSVGYETIPLSKIKFQKAFIIGYSYRSQDLFYSKYGIDKLCEPTSFVFENEKESYMAPIILLEQNGMYIVLKGHVRAYYAFRQGMQDVRAVVIHDFDEEEFGCLYDIHQVNISDNTSLKNLPDSLNVYLKDKIEKAFEDVFMSGI